MRMSCNGCRVLRKGCSEACTIRPCLQWINSPDSQANATLFLAKFYGRAGLLNLIEAGPPHLRPAIFRSLLYEACGRVVNPVYGLVGMLCFGNWAQCQAAVDAVLKGSPITQTSSSSSSELHAPHAQPISPLKTYDIRHVSKDPKPDNTHRVKNRSTRFKRSVKRSKQQVESPSYDSWMSHRGNGDSKEDESMFSVETVEASLVKQSQKVAAFCKCGSQAEGSSDAVGLELTLGLRPAALQTHNLCGVSNRNQSVMNCMVDRCQLQ